MSSREANGHLGHEPGTQKRQELEMGFCGYCTSMHLKPGMVWALLGRVGLMRRKETQSQLSEGTGKKPGGETRREGD